MTRWETHKHSKKYVQEYITVSEALTIIKACANPRDKLILRTMWETAGRVSEVLSLVPENIDIGTNSIFLINLKQGRPDLKRVYLFPESTLCKDLIDYCHMHDITNGRWIFQGGVKMISKNDKIQKRDRRGQVSPTYIWYLIANPMEIGRRPGIATTLNINKTKEGRRVSAWPHLFRHGAAMNIYRRTGRLDVTQKELGHSNIATTEIYAQLMDNDVKEIIEHS